MNDLFFFVGTDNEIDTEIWNFDNALSSLRYYLNFTLCHYNSLIPFILYNKKEDKFIHEFYHIFVEIILVIILWPSCSLEIWYISKEEVGVIMFGLDPFLYEWKGLEIQFFLSENIIKLSIFSFIKIYYM